LGRIEIATIRTNREWQRVLPGIALSILSIGLVLYLVDLRQVGNAFGSLNIFFIILTILITLIWLVVRSMVWRTLLQEQATFGQVFFTLNEGYLMNNILPFRLGEVGRAFLLGRKTGLGFWQVASSIVIERALDLGLAAGLLLGVLPFVVGAAWAWQGALLAGSMVITAFALMYLAARRREATMQLVEKMSERWPIIMKVGGTAIPAFLSGLGVLTDGRRFLNVMAWMLLNWCLTIGQHFILLIAFFPSAQILWAMFSVGVVSLGIAAPAMPGAIGVWELSTVASLSLFNLDPSVALAYALTVHFSNYLVTGVLGAYAFARDGESLLGVFQRLRGEDEKVGVITEKRSE
jgi:glycosyltransferase 2 family protein